MTFANQIMADVANITREYGPVETLGGGGQVMTISHDRSYISADMNELVTRGYAAEDLHSLRLSYEYTEEEKAANKAFAESHSPREWSARCTDAAQHRSSAMQPIMEAIAEKFVCYQFTPDCGAEYLSADWDLYFWCNDFYETTCGALSGRDFSYFTLTFNERMTLEQRLNLCNRVLSFMIERFAENLHLKVAVQYTVTEDKEKITADAKAAVPSLVGKKCTYGHMDGKIVQTSEGVFFVKRYAKSKGYLLADTDILRLSWNI